MVRVRARSPLVEVRARARARARMPYKGLHLGISHPGIWESVIQESTVPLGFFLGLGNANQGPSSGAMAYIYAVQEIKSG